MTNDPELKVARVYFVHGACPKDWARRNMIQNPPCSGYGIVVVLPSGGASSLLFSPFTLESWMVHNRMSSEMASAVYLEDLVDLDFGRVAEAIKRAWLRHASYGAARDYDLAASVLRRLGHEPPAATPAAIAVEDGRRQKGGKEPGEETKPMRRGTKRAAVAEFFLETASVREAMHELGLTRSGVLSHLHCIRKYNGFGYEVVGDSARLLVPDGRELFDDEGS
jgi:hypothetical protein